MYITTIENANNLTESEILLIKKAIQNKFGGVLKLRGRHSNRKSVLGFKWHKGTQNDIPWRLAETIAVYKIK